jgi:hypothetical protein
LMHKLPKDDRVVRNLLDLFRAVLSGV